MTADAIQILQFIFNVIWKMFTSWHIPGTNVTPAAMGFFLLVAAMIINSIKSVLLSVAVGAGRNDEETIKADHDRRIAVRRGKK